MSKNVFLSGFLLLLGWSLLAQGSVRGTVYFGADAQFPVPNWPVQFFMGENLLVAEGETDEAGNFLLSTDATIAGESLWWVEVLDMCLGTLVRAEFEVLPDVLNYEQDVIICADVNPPPPPDTCQAYFSAEQQFHQNPPFTVAFYDLSFSPFSHDSTGYEWYWEFGDDSTSTEQFPRHTYTAAGSYLVSLTITHGDCQSTITQEIEIIDLNDCGCATDEVIPVCVRMPSGQVIPFDSGCWAECAGFTDWYVCDSECFCPEYYDPVCILTASGDTISFSNACFAQCEGFSEEEFFSCHPNSGCDCPDIYDPVCVATPGLGLILTFNNACEAECAGYGPDIYYACDGGCICPEFYSPVCVIDDSGDTLTFDNYCFAECEGYGPDQWLDCEIDPCNCPDDLYDPVCVHTPAGRILFNNACEAECAGFEPGMYQPCDGDCACPEIYDPVCVWDSPSGAILSFDNFCLAQCAGYGPDQWVACEPNECDCPEDLYDPVCVTTDAGTTVNFPNPCYAECAGYTPDQWQPCVPDCVCPDYLDPVCVLQDDGTEIEFPNACMALCQGYSPTDWVYCGTEPCDCPQDVYDPVCVQGPISIVEFINACEAECAGFGEDDFLDNCPQECQCEEVHDPVCVVLEDGVFFFFINACEARCAGFTDDQFGPCQPECDCPGLWAPVCVVTPDGAEIRFANACEAECAGYGADEIIECEDTGCECEEFYFPVCVLAASGELLEFLNPCEALCAGYGSDQIIECDRGQNCHADFTFDFLTDDGLSVQFHDLSLLEGGTSSWFWDFGDGHTSTEPAPVHTFEAPGLYDVVLTVSNDTCGTLAITQHLCVGEGGGVPGPDCQAFFFLEQPDPDNLLTFQFLNLSVGEGTAYVWDFGDGTTSTQVNPLHTYAVAGIYTVSLTVLGENCDHTVSVPINAGENIWYGNLECRAWFLPIMEAESNAVFLVNLSTPDAVSFAWDFGDGTSSDHASAYHQYEGPGTYTVSLTITTAEGCSSTFSATLNFGQGDFHPAPPFTLINNTEDSQATGPVDVRAWPNPTNALVTINWRSSTSADTWQLFNLNGQRLRSGTVIPVKGEGRLPLDLADLPDGIYLFRLQTTDGVETLRLSKF